MELRHGSSVLLGDGTTLKPLEDSQLSNDARVLFQSMKPALAMTMGQMGQAIQFIVFEGKNTKGKRHMDPTKEGNFSFKFRNRTFKWRLPLGSLLPPRYDPATNETFPGNYSYNPYTGRKLVKEQSNTH